MAKIDPSTLTWPRTIGLSMRDIGLAGNETPQDLLDLLDMTDDPELRQEAIEKLNAAAYVVEQLMRSVSQKQFCNEPVIQSAMTIKKNGTKELVGLLPKDHKIDKFKADPWRYLSEMEFTSSSHAMAKSPLRRAYEDKTKGWLAQCPKSGGKEPSIEDISIWEPTSLTELLALEGDNAVRFMEHWCKRNDVEVQQKTRSAYIKAIRQNKGF